MCLHYIININNLLYVVLEVKNMKSKSLINIALIGASCIAVSVSFVVGSKAHQDDFSPVRSQESEYTVVMNKDTLRAGVSYTSKSSGPSSQYAFFPMQYEGNYAVLDDYSSTSPSVWNKNGHLYYNESPNGLNYRISCKVDVDGFRDSVMYFDSNCTQRINIPGFNKLTKIQFTTASENQVAFDQSYFDRGEQINISGNTITISHTNLSKLYSGITILDFTNKSESDYGTKLVIDEIILTYTC